MQAGTVRDVRPVSAMQNARTPTQKSQPPVSWDGMSRRKGNAGQLEVAKILGRLYCWAKSTAGSQSAGAVVPDVDGTPWWIEVKRHAKVNWRPAYRQACGDADGRLPMVAHRDDRGEWMVTLRLEHFVDAMDGAPAAAYAALLAAVRILEPREWKELKRARTLAQGLAVRAEGRE